VTDVPVHRLIETTVHGRYLIRDGPESHLLIGFHGYAETAEIHLSELERFPDATNWTLVAVQALHPFYVRSTQQVVASWMTNLDRMEAIADNIAYVNRVVASLPPANTLVFAGFSQGAAMAYRAANAIPCGGLIILCGDLPPDAAAEALPPLLIGRGMRDDWYSAEKLKKDLKSLEGSNQAVEALEFEGGHEWTDAFRTAAGKFLERIRMSSGLSCRP
jgi:predicted esterase